MRCLRAGTEIIIEAILMVSSKSGVQMDVENETSKFRLGALFLAVLGASILLNLSYLYDEPFDGWVSVGLPVALSLGFVGSAWNYRLLRLIGWISVAVFMLVELISIVPGEEYTLGGPGSPPGPTPHLLPHNIIVLRTFLFVGGAILLALCYWWAGQPRRRSSNDN
jgi:hypothetical protein